MTFEKWIKDNVDEIAQSRAFALSDRAYEPSEVDEAIKRSRTDHARMGVLLSQMKTFHAQAREMASKRIRAGQPDLTAPEKKIAAEADPEYCKVREIMEDLEVVVSALNKLHYELRDFRRNILDRRMESDE